MVRRRNSDSELGWMAVSSASSRDATASCAVLVLVGPCAGGILPGAPGCLRCSVVGVTRCVGGNVGSLTNGLITATAGG